MKQPLRGLQVFAIRNIKEKFCHASLCEIQSQLTILVLLRKKHVFHLLLILDEENLAASPYALLTQCWKQGWISVNLIKNSPVTIPH